MTNGFLPVDKPEGPTSHDVVALVRRAFDMRRVGHAGTLDPFATGMLLVLVGQATRLTPYLVGLPKAYTGILRLGTRTTTDDLTGEPLSAHESWRDLRDEDVSEAMSGFVGGYTQQPPLYSAVKIGGEAAHRRVRRGETVTLEPRVVEVAGYTMLARDGADVTFSAEVGSGTYVRALARDLGDRLGCGAHLRSLRRTAVGPFEIGECVSLEDVRRGAVVLKPAGEAVRHLPALTVDAASCVHLRHGRSIPAGQERGAVAVFSGGELVAVAEGEGSDLHPRVVLDS